MNKKLNLHRQDLNCPDLELGGWRHITEAQQTRDTTILTRKFFNLIIVSVILFLMWCSRMNINYFNLCLMLIKINDNGNVFTGERTMMCGDSCEENRRKRSYSTYKIHVKEPQQVREMILGSFRLILFLKNYLFLKWKKTKKNRAVYFSF